MTAREDLAAVATEGIVGVSIIAGHLRATDEPAHPKIGRQVFMGRGSEFAIHITNETAKQWIETLTPIANEGINE